jgi:hypothetical protein
MSKRISVSLKRTLSVYAAIAGIVGLQHMIMPQLPGDIAGITLPSPILYRVIGAAVFAFATGAWLASRAHLWENVQIIVIMQIIWSFTTALIIAIGISTGKLPAIEWPNVFLLLIFGVLFSFFLSSHRSAGNSSP